MITVFTPVYNRANIIKNLYESLRKQTDQNFEWVVVDDGSNDNICEVMQEFIAENAIKINFAQQKNFGKHVAINTGLDMAQGEYFFIVDSDDELPLDSIENICKFTKTIENESDFAGVSGFRQHKSTNEMDGATFEGEYFDCTSLERFKNNILGEKAEVFKTEILRKYKFPVFEGENFVSERTVWNEIAHDGYKIRWFNVPTYTFEYLDDGLTKTKGKFFKNYQGFIELVRRQLRYKEIPKKENLKNFVICCVYAKKKKYSYKTLAKQLGKSVVTIFLAANLGNMLYKFFGGSVN